MERMNGVSRDCLNAFNPQYPCGLIFKFGAVGHTRTYFKAEANGLLDNVAHAIADGVIDGEATWSAAAGLTSGRDDGADAVISAPLSDAVGVVDLAAANSAGLTARVPHQALHTHTGHKRLELGRLVGLAGQQ